MRHFSSLTCALAFGLAVFFSAQAFAYDLGAMDVVRLRVAEWQSAEAQFREWEPLGGEYTVGPDGQISVPLVGQVEAAGRTTGEVEQTISDRLQQKFGLIDRPEAAIEITRYRPFYVSGGVDAPGAYPFEPGLTVVKAASIAGGTSGSTDTAPRAERDLLQARGSIEVLRAQMRNLLVRQARAEAAINGQNEFALPERLADDPLAQNALRREQAILRTESEELATGIQALEDEKALLENELTSLESKRRSLASQSEIIAQDLTNVGSLADRGLTNASRVSDLRRQAAEIEGRILDTQTAALRVRQDINRANERQQKLRTDFRSQHQALNDETASSIEEVELQIRTQAGLVQEAASLMSGGGLVSAAPDSVSYSITRLQDGEQVTFAAERNTEMLPGDILNVELADPLEGF